jgi:hypothetical protein
MLQERWGTSLRSAFLWFRLQSLICLRELVLRLDEMINHERTSVISVTYLWPYRLIFVCIFHDAFPIAISLLTIRYRHFLLTCRVFHGNSFMPVKDLISVIQMCFMILILTTHSPCHRRPLGLLRLSLHVHECCDNAIKFQHTRQDVTWTTHLPCTLPMLHSTS